METAPRNYRPIESYAVIGNLRTAAIVGRDGSIDWLCLPDLSSPSVFAGILDPVRGGHFSVSALSGEAVDQRYIRHTNVLETHFDADGGRLVITDFMPLEGSLDGAGDRSKTEPAVYRILRAEGGPVDVRVEWAPRPDYGRAHGQAARTESGILAWAGEDALTLSGLDDDASMDGDERGPVIRARFTLQAGERRVLVTRWGSEEVAVSLDEAESKLAATVEAWRSWVHKPEATGDRSWGEDHAELLIRSELALKLLSNAESGAIAAAVTTSLPEEIGGVRNWDYRYSWIRDAALGAQALYAMGHAEDAQAFVNWAERTVMDTAKEDSMMRIVYGLHGEVDLDEEELPNLAGYCRSAPVRTGNGAKDQLQLDIYGELISAVYEIVRLGGDVPDDIRRFLPKVADQACDRWTERDYGLWEIRSGPFNFVYSKAMVWMALDRAIRLARKGVIKGNVKAWSEARTAVRNDVLDRGYDPDLGAFRQSYERSVPDASNLLLPMLELLPFSDPRVRSNIDVTLERLTENDLVYRYKSDDGIAGGEGAFVLCTFWMVDALALAGRLDEARRIFEGVAGRANHVGLFSEQIDAGTGAFLGNFPQAFSHIGVINSALYLAHAEGRDTPIPDPIGSDEHRRNGDEGSDGSD
jgi:GH15 family glucan-1,4-alpha-glucosidase